MLGRRIHRKILVLFPSRRYLLFKRSQIVANLLKAHRSIIKPVENSRIAPEIIKCSRFFQCIAVFIGNGINQIKRGLHIRPFVKTYVGCVKPPFFIQMRYKILQKRPPYLRVLVCICRICRHRLNRICFPILIFHNAVPRHHAVTDNFVCNSDFLVQNHPFIKIRIVKFPGVVRMFYPLDHGRVMDVISSPVSLSAPRFFYNTGRNRMASKAFVDFHMLF